jgi:outer membrane biosynthesis protein TonB
VAAHITPDVSALQTASNWRFRLARKGGHKVDKWFMIPVRFSLKDNAA